MININNLFHAFDQSKLFYAEVQDIESDFKSVETMFEEKRAKPDALIMIYGVYNAGKSTLINAMLGREEAKMGDIPLTNKIDSYKCLNFDIIDTPGIDAPIEHEEVTNELLEKADAVIFVVNPIGAAEEIKTLELVIKNVKEGRKIFIAFNEKMDLSDEEFVKLKDKVWRKIQELAIPHKIDKIVKNIPIVRINAKRALKGRVEGKNLLIESSGYNDFIVRISEFVQSISHNEVHENLRSRLIQCLGKTENKIKESSSSENADVYDNLITNVNTNKLNIYRFINSDIDGCKDDVRDFIRNKLRCDGDNAAELINSHCQEITSDLLNKLSVELNAFAEGVGADIIKAEFKFNAQFSPIINVVELNEAGENIKTDTAHDKYSKLNDVVNVDTVSKAVSQIKPEHIVSAMKFGKGIAPSIFKGIGLKTMEKLAVGIASKLPFLGAAIAVGAPLLDLFRDDPNENIIKNSINEKAQARERLIQEIEDNANDGAREYKMALSLFVNDQINSFFSAYTDKIQMIKQSLNENERLNSERIEKIQSLKLLAENA